MSVAERGTYKDFKLKLTIWGKKFEKKELRGLNLWVYKNAPEITEPKLQSTKFWDLVGKRLYHSAANRNCSTQKLTPIFQKVYSMIQLEEKERNLFGEEKNLSDSKKPRYGNSPLPKDFPPPIPADRHGAEMADA